MKTFILKLALLFVVLSIVDRLGGKALSYADSLSSKKSGCAYIMDKLDYKILIFGSSRAYRHYNPQIIGDAYHASCYNCGQDNQGFIHNYALLKAVAERYKPSLLIYDINPSLDFLVGDNYRSLRNLRPYKDRPVVAEIMRDIDPKESVKSYSELYCYNYVVNSILYRLLHLSKEKSRDGYVPLDQQNKHTFLGKKVLDIKREYCVDSLKLQYADKFAQLSKKTTDMLFVISPRWYGMDTQYVKMAKEFAAKYNVSLIDFSNNPKYVHNDEYFYDGTHLNERGADEFTKDLMYEMRSMI